tara:strand:+ start:1791 stop:2684 length:894 start_codon:yes stop_codon:yes gene_type:complete
MNKYIIYDNTPWEKQYLFQDLFNVDVLTYEKIIYTNNDLNYSKISNWEKLDNINDIINNNILIFTSNKRQENSYENILKLSKLLKPIIIIHLSDEFGNRPRYQGLYEYTKLLLRQHYHPGYFYKSNIKCIPLGYMDGMLETDYMNLQLKLPTERKYKWSFVGNMKHDRKKMINTMNSITPKYTGKLDKIEMRNIYRDSIFVPNGRGYIKLDCFRLYEASLCGAIPIIVGPKSETDPTFSQEENPPWLIFESWEEAKRECLELLKDMDYLNKLSQKNINWWRNRILKLRDLISKTITS